MWKLCAVRLKLIGCIAALFLFTAVSVNAETLYALVRISPLNEVPPITTLDATGTMLVTIDVTRNSAGTITGARMSFLGAVTFPGAVTIQGLHIHEAAAGVNGPVRFDTGLNAGNTLVFANGSGIVGPYNVANVNLEILGRLLANPAGWYVNLHTSVNPGGALRAQLTRFSENLAMTTAMSTANEVPPITTQTAFGTATITVNPTRNAAGAVTGGSVNFTVGYDLPPNAVVRGLHIHEGPAGVNAGVVIDTGLSATNNFVTPTGRGTYSSTILLTTPASIAAMMRLLNNPANFYVNLHTNDFPGGVIRGQLGGSFNPAPQIAQVNTFNLTTGASGATVNALVANLDSASEALVNGEPAASTFNPATGVVSVQIPANLRASSGVIALQIRNGNGLISQPVFIVVAADEGTNAAVLDSAGYGNVLAPEGLASVFGVNLATTTATAGPILPNALGGTSVYVNGVAAPLFYVSPGQVNFQVPEGTVPGPAVVVVRNSNGVIARSLVNVGTTGPGIFTRLASGKGAPHGVVSTDNGQTYSLLTSNADGTPVEIQVGNIAVLFGTGFRFRSASEITATAGGVTLTTTMVGAQGTMVGLDQINLIIPESLRGKGEMDLVFTIDGKQTNPVRIKVR